MSVDKATIPEDKPRNWVLAIDLQQAWRKYADLFGEPPHGILKQLLAMLEFAHVTTEAYERAKSLDSVARELAQRMQIIQDRSMLGSLTGSESTAKDLHKLNSDEARAAIAAAKARGIL